MVHSIVMLLKLILCHVSVRCSAAGGSRHLMLFLHLVSMVLSVCPTYTLLHSQEIWYMLRTFGPKLSLTDLSKRILFLARMWMVLMLCWVSCLLILFVAQCWYGHLNTLQLWLTFTISSTNNVMPDVSVLPEGLLPPLQFTLKALSTADASSPPDECGHQSSSVPDGLLTSHEGTNLSG